MYIFSYIIYINVSEYHHYYVKSTCIVQSAFVDAGCFSGATDSLCHFDSPRSTQPNILVVS